MLEKINSPADIKALHIMSLKGWQMKYAAKL